MKFLHKSISNLPIIIVIWWLICALLFTKSEFYYDHFELLDKIDTYVVYFSLMHFMFFIGKYSTDKKIFASAIFLSIILRLVSDFLNEEVYYFLYYSIVLMPLIVCAWRAKKY